jgi:oxygen-dependent protoporphyrinogen oxidase
MRETALEEQRDVVVVGAGIAGLAAAHRLCGRGHGSQAPDVAGPGAEGPRRITLLEAAERLGGKIRTESFAGRPLDVGAEALLARVPAGAELCRELGLDGRLVAPASDQAFLWSEELHALPPRLLSGAPDGTRAVIASGVLSPMGLLRAGLDLVVPARPLRGDVSIGSLVRRRLGSQVLERFIDPLLGGIHAGSCEELSVRAVAPQFEAALEKRRSLIRGLRSLGGSPAPAGPVFLSIDGGLETIVHALQRSLEAIELRTATAVQSVQAQPGGGARLQLADGSRLSARNVILAVPAQEAARLLAEACPGASAELAGIGYASVATVALAYPAEALERPLAGSGFLATRAPGRTITACTWSSAKWRHLGGATVLMKCSVGHAGDRRALELDDEHLVAAVRTDLEHAMGLRAAPLQWKVFRFEQALPQYTVGHLERVKRIEAEMAGLPGVGLCGAAYHGVGVASCIADGRAAADAVLTRLRDRGEDEDDQQPPATLALASS